MELKLPELNLDTDSPAFQRASLYLSFYLAIVIFILIAYFSYGSNYSPVTYSTEVKNATLDSKVSPSLRKSGGYRLSCKIRSGSEILSTKSKSCLEIIETFGATDKANIKVVEMKRTVLGKEYLAGYSILEFEGTKLEKSIDVFR